MVTPFVVLLAGIALAPLCFSSWWGKHYGKVSLILASIVIGYYWFGLGAEERLLQTAEEYFSFICLIGSLFVISGGIHLSVLGEATPGANVLFLLIGTIVANFLGTTGASMLLIRPWLRMNKYRLTGHHVVFFIFLVSNVGGCLTPVGDPPLFLGYLKGVPFWWVAKACWPMWLTGVGLLLLLFYLVDSRNFRRAPQPVRERETAHEQWKAQGLGNLGFLAVVLGAVFLRQPPFLREGLMIAAAAASYLTTAPRVHQANDFSFHPLQEVTILFAGIFSTMLPALDWLQAHAANFAHPSPGLFFWGSGALSSVLDNAPTYLSFLSAAIGTSVPPDLANAVLAEIGSSESAGKMVGSHSAAVAQALTALRTWYPNCLATGTVTREQVEMAILLNNPLSVHCLQALSIGSVFFGANTYIGNGPNFMVKAIADRQNAHTPDFVSYLWKFTLPFALPMLLVIWFLFFRA